VTAPVGRERIADAIKSVEWTWDGTEFNPTLYLALADAVLAEIGPDDNFLATTLAEVRELRAEVERLREGRSGSIPPVPSRS
jgi:hypothetical protein